MTTANLFVMLGGFLAALAVGLGAVGAHALKGHLTTEQLQTFHTAVQYQMYHAIGLLLVGLLALHRPSRAFSFAGWSMLAGILLFSGLLYAWLATGQRILVCPVPVGRVRFHRGVGIGSRGGAGTME